MRNLLYTALVALLITACTKPTSEDGDVIPPPPDRVTVEPPTTGTTSDTTSGQTTDTTDTQSGTSTETVNPKDGEDEWNAINEYCDTDYRPQTQFEAEDSPKYCGEGANSPHTFIHGQLAVANDHTLRLDQSIYIAQYNDALDLIVPADRFYESISHLPIVIEDNTEYGSFSSASGCGVSMHDGHGHTHETFSGVLIHELGHSWQERLNFCHNETINTMFDAQLAKWNNGTSPWGQGENRPYQLFNQGEYLACAIAAYFNANDGFGTIENLQEEDPDMYNFINTLAN